MQTWSVTKRGCGWPKEGGLYLIGGRDSYRSCGKLPISLNEINRCPCCGEPLPHEFCIHVSRAPRMLEQPEAIWRRKECRYEAGCRSVGGDPRIQPGVCRECPMGNWFESGPALLIWIGEQYYPTPADFAKEILAQGLSRRLQALPKGFKVGETWVLLGHPKTIPVEREKLVAEVKGQKLLVPEVRKATEYEPGLFGMFKPSAIYKVAKGDETPEELAALEKRGVTPVQLQRVGDDEQERSA